MKRTGIAAVTALVLTLAHGDVAVAQGEGAQTAPSRATLDEVLAELRALRAELIEVAHASLRAQLLVARLALQEQRITTVSKELADVHEKLQANDRQRPTAHDPEDRHDQRRGGLAPFRIRRLGGKAHGRRSYLPMRSSVR